MDAPANTPPPVAGTNGPGTKARTRQTPIVRFPIQLRINITPAMNASLEQLSRRLLLPKGTIGRIALMTYLAANDPSYSEDQ
jgi:hypothetical protein